MHSMAQIWRERTSCRTRFSPSWGLNSDHKSYPQMPLSTDAPHWQITRASRQYPEVLTMLLGNSMAAPLPSSTSGPSGTNFASLSKLKLEGLPALHSRWLPRPVPPSPSAVSLYNGLCSVFSVSNTHSAFVFWFVLPGVNPLLHIISPEEIKYHKNVNASYQLGVMV